MRFFYLKNLALALMGNFWEKKNPIVFPFPRTNMFYSERGTNNLRFGRSSPISVYEKPLSLLSEVPVPPDFEQNLRERLLAH